VDFVSCRPVPLRRLRLPGSFKQRLREPRINSLAQHIEKRGLWLPVLVRKEDGRVLDGLDRVASFWLLGRESILAVVVTCSDEEADTLEREINAERRHAPEEQRSKALEMVEKLSAEEAEAAVEAAQKEHRAGRPLSKKGRARKVVAESLGISPKALKQQEYRERRKKGLTKNSKAIETIGMEIPESMAKEVRSVQLLMEEAALRVSQALAALTTIENQSYRFPAARLQRLRSDTVDLGACLRNARPEMLCPYCKAIPQLMPGCTACLGCGWICANQVAAVPKELLREDLPCVLVGGSRRSIWDYIPQDPEPPKADEAFGFGDE